MSTGSNLCVQDSREWGHLVGLRFDVDLRTAKRQTRSIEKGKWHRCLSHNRHKKIPIQAGSESKEKSKKRILFLLNVFHAFDVNFERVAKLLIFQVWHLIQVQMHQTDLWSFSRGKVINCCLRIWLWDLSLTLTFFSFCRYQKWESRTVSKR